MTRAAKVLALVLGFQIHWSQPVSAAPAFTPTGPANTKVSLFAEATNARQMALSPRGLLYVGSMEAGSVSVIHQGKTLVLFKDLTYPTGLLWHKGDLYIAEIPRLSVVRKIDDLVLAKKPLQLTVLKADFPEDLNHGWKHLTLGSDNKIYFGIGAPCNVCETTPPYGSIHRIGLDGKNMELMAQGIRNSVGATFHPITQELWFTEMGRDMMGDDLPPDEINILVPGAHYGFPHLHASKVKDPHYFGKLPKNLKTNFPVGEIPAHSAPIGIVFTHNTPFAQDYPGCFFVALHGSWNRSKKSGYEVKVGCPDKNKSVSELKPFLQGFLRGESTLGRPVDLRFDASGALLVSDDHAGAIWKVERKP